MSEIIFESQLLSIGLFRLKPWEPCFENTGPIGSYLLVFPRTSVSITHVGKEPVIANPNVVMFYNQGQEYHRRKVSERGDICEWFAFRPDVIIEAHQPFDITVMDRMDNPFCFTHGPSDPHTFLLQRMVVEHILHHGPVDHLFVLETILQVLDQSLANRYGLQKQKKCSGQINPEHHELVRATQRLLATRFHEPLTLEDLATAMNYSQYHLAHIFRQQTGQTIHQYLNQIRLRTALEELTTGIKDLNALAHTLGYSSHSHFSQAFKRTFGHTPSGLRQRVINPDLFQTEANLA